MDFLDPRLRRSYNIRLLVGYMLITTVIGLATLILVLGAYGYGINTKTGQIIQNGLLFVDSQPGGAEIYLNGKDIKAATASRLVLPAGDYSLSIKRSGYRDWSRSFTLDEHSIARFTYPLLFPLKPAIASLKSYSSMPAVITQSPDRRWLLVETPEGGFDEFDTNDLTKAPVPVDVPATALSDNGQSSQFEVEQWSSDNNFILLRHVLASGSEFVVLNRDKPSASININKLFLVSPSSVFMKNQKADQIYIYDQSAHTVSLADIGKSSLGAPILSQVLAFKPYSSDLASYVTDKGAPAGQVEARIWSNGKTYRLYDFKPGSRYFLDAAQFSGHWYYLAGSDNEARISVFKDPLTGLQAKPPLKPAPIVALNQLGADIVDFSAGSARFIEAEKGSNFSVYDLEAQKSFSFSLSVPLAGTLKWLDGARLIGDSNGQLFVMDYDSLNQQLVANTSEIDGGFLSRDLNHMLTLSADSQKGTVELMNIDMRAGVDLPKQP